MSVFYSLQKKKSSGCLYISFCIQPYLSSRTELYMQYNNPMALSAILLEKKSQKSQKKIVFKNVDKIYLKCFQSFHVTSCSLGHRFSRPTTRLFCCDSSLISHTSQKPFNFFHISYILYFSFISISYVVHLVQIHSIFFRIYDNIYSLP